MADGLGRTRYRLAVQQLHVTPMIDAPGATSSSASALRLHRPPPCPLHTLNTVAGVRAPPQIRDVSSHVEFRRTHVEDILPVNAGQAARSFSQMICQTVISRDPREIRSADAIMTNGSLAFVPRDHGAEGMSMLPILHETKCNSV